MRETVVSFFSAVVEPTSGGNLGKNMMQATVLPSFAEAQRRRRDFSPKAELKASLTNAPIVTLMIVLNNRCVP